MVSKARMISVCICFILTVVSLSFPRQKGNQGSLAQGGHSGGNFNVAVREKISPPQTPPPRGEPSLVCEGVDVGNISGGPVNYPNARHVIHHPEGHPWVAWEWGPSKNNNMNVSRWHNWREWSNPVVVSDQDIDAGRCALGVDSRGNIHAAWHQTDDGETYYIRYAKQLNGSPLWSHYAEFHAYDNYAFPSITVDYLDNPWVIFFVGGIDEPVEILVAHSLSQGETWEDIEIIPGGPYRCTWMLPTIDAGADGSIHAQFMGDDTGVYYSCRDPLSGLWSHGEAAAHGENGLPLHCATMVVDSQGIVHMAGFQDYGESSTNYGAVGVIKYWCGTGGDWSEPEAPFCDGESREDSLASYPTLGLDDRNNIYIVFSRADTLINDQPVSGVFFSTRPFGTDDWDIQENLLVPDEFDCVFPQITKRVSTDGSIPGPGIAWSEMVDAAPPSSVYYMWLGGRGDLPPVTIEAFDTPASAFKSTFAEGKLYVIENTGRDQVLDMWLHITGESLEKPCMVMLQEGLTVPANFEGAVTVRHWIPGRAPLGCYHVTCMIGHYPDGPLDTSSFLGDVTG